MGWSVRGWVWGISGVVAALTILATVTWYSLPDRIPPDREWEHVFRVLLRGDGNYRDPRVRRWQGEIRITLGEHRSEDDTFIRALVHELDRLLVGTDTWLKLGDFDQPDIRVFFIPPDSVADTGQAADFPLGDSQEGRARTWPDEEDRIRKGLIIVRDYADTKWRRPIIIEEIAQSLAAMNNSPFMPESQFYESADGETNYYMRLPEIDRKLVRFVYLYLKPGDGVDEVRRAYDAHWRTMKVPPRPETNRPKTE